MVPSSRGSPLVVVAFLAAVTALGLLSVFIDYEGVSVSRLSEVGNVVTRVGQAALDCAGKTLLTAKSGYVKSGVPFQNASGVFVHFESNITKDMWNLALPSDKHLHHNYTKYYDHLLAPYVAAPSVSLLEVGVKLGGGLMLFRELFSASSWIYGLDTELWVPMFEQEPHVKVLAGIDSTDAASMDRSLADLQFDVIVDDAAHERFAQVATLKTLWKRLKPTGVYIVEDVKEPCALLKLAWAAVGGIPARSIKQSFQQAMQDLEGELQNRSAGSALARISIHKDRNKVYRLVVLYPNQSWATPPSPVQCTQPTPGCMDAEQVEPVCNTSIKAAAKGRASIRKYMNEPSQ